MTREFICVECGTPIWRAIPLTTDEPRLCANCINIPGWFHDPQLRNVLDRTNLIDPAKLEGHEPS